MDAAGVDVQVLSIMGHGIQEAGAAGVELARAANDRLAAAVAEHPDRFSAFATLPLGDPAAAAEELRRTVGDAGFVGAMVFGQTHGRFLDDPEFAPVLATCAELGVPLYLHPAPPPPAVADVYFARLPERAGATLATAGWGWHVETGMHVLRLAVAGTFDAHPTCGIVIGHMGENLPFSLARADERLNASSAGERPVMQTVLDQVRITTAGYITAPPLACALAAFGPERILFSVDHPFADSRRGHVVPARRGPRRGRPGAHRPRERRGPARAVASSSRPRRVRCAQPAATDAQVRHARACSSTASPAAHARTTSSPTPFQLSGRPLRRWWWMEPSSSARRSASTAPPTRVARSSGEPAGAGTSGATVAVGRP